MRSHAVEDAPPSMAPFDPFANVSYIPNVAEIGTSKTDDCLIDSEASHNFFYQKSVFLSYKNIENNFVRVANRTSRIVAEENVKIQFGNK